MEPHDFGIVASDLRGFARSGKQAIRPDIGITGLGLVPHFNDHGATGVEARSAFIAKCRTYGSAPSVLAQKFVT